MTLRLLLLPAAFVALAAPALAQKSAADEGYSYQMEEDFVDGGELGGTGPRLTIRGKQVRVLLIRPRTSFVAQLLKTVETL
jgi:hypothetical protein